LLDAPAERDGPPMLRERDLRSYQRYLAEQIEAKEFVLGAAEMSLGKTGATLTAVRRLLRKRKVRRVLVVAPLTVATDTWPDEIERWEHLSDLTYAVAVGDEATRLAAIRQNVEITIINRENLQWLWRVIGGRAGWVWDMLVYDESSRLKAWRVRTPGKKADGTATKRNLTEFGVLLNARPAISRVVELSGTPAPNGVFDLGGQARIGDGGKRLGATKQAFTSRWFEVNPWTHQVTPKENARPEIMSRLKDVMIGLRATDYIDLPPVVIDPRYVRLSNQHMRQYREFEHTLVAEAYDVEAVNSAVLTNKLLQFANGSLYRLDEEVYPPKKETVHIHDAKLKALESIIEEAAGKPVLIAYSFKFDLARIKKRFPKAVVFDEEPNFVKKWNAGKIQIGVAHPASMSHGLNLQFGGFIQVWYGLNWSLELWKQFNARLARPGQESPTVFIYVILAKGTADEDVFERLKEKDAEQDDITDAVRVRLTL
jgi:SNF2 family DNA or RNA helicase